MFEIGQEIELIYPTSTDVQYIANAARKLRQLKVKRVRDLVAEPLTPEEFLRRPFVARSRWLILATEGIGLPPKQFYVGSADNYQAPGVLRLAIYERGCMKPKRYFGPQIDETVLARRRLIQLLRQKMTHPDYQVRVVADDLRLLVG